MKPPDQFYTGTGRTQVSWQLSVTDIVSHKSGHQHGATDTQEAESFSVCYGLLQNLLVVII